MPVQLDMIKEYLWDIYNEKMNKNKALREIYLLLVKFFGKPPYEFDWEYMDKNNKYKIKKNLNVEKFTKMVKIDLHDYICLINDPRNEYDYIYNLLNYNLKNLRQKFHYHIDSIYL